MEIPPELRDVVVLSVMNLGTILGGFLVGRRADQVQKIVVGAFVSGVCGVLFAWLLGATGLADVHSRLLSGVFVLSFVLGVVWAWIGFKTRKPA